MKESLWEFPEGEDYFSEEPMVKTPAIILEKLLEQSLDELPKRISGGMFGVFSRKMHGEIPRMAPLYIARVISIGTPIRTPMKILCGVPSENHREIS